jgi:stage V sporulation protein D (sporulation-specific penicillin-binding protein)
VSLPAESRGTLREPRRWSRRSLASIAIGQEIGVTPMQMAMAYCALANGGELLAPRIALAEKDERGRIVQRFPVIKVRRVFSRETAETLKEFCADVVESGTGTKARVKGLTVGGKTGTSQKAGENGYRTGAYVASFIGFAPQDDPRVVCLVLLDEPAYPYYWGGESAAIVFSKIVEGIYLTTDLLKADDARRIAFGYGEGDAVTVPNFLRMSYAEALDLAAGSGLRIAGSSESGVCYSQMPDPGSALETGGEVRLLFGSGVETGAQVRVPDLRGLSVREARRMLIGCGLRGSVSGFGVVKRQAPAPGIMVARRSSVALECSPKQRIGTRRRYVYGSGGAG